MLYQPRRGAGVPRPLVALTLFVLAVAMVLAYSVWPTAGLDTTAPADQTPADVSLIELADTPVAVVTDNVEEWTVGQGLLYWASNCFADEFNPYAELKRKPAGGAIPVVLESINDGNRCATYHAMLSAGDGLYYYSYSQNRIERMPLSAPFIPQVVKTVTSGQAPLTNEALVEGGDYLYWVSAFGGVYRTRKDGAGSVETVATTSGTPADVLAIGNTIYWTDSSGVWAIGVGCGALPCTGAKIQLAAFGANTAGHGLVYLYLGGAQGNFRVYWVQRPTVAPYIYSIRYRACNQISACVIGAPVTFYTATTGWAIGNLALANNTFYWTERDISTPVNSTGDVKRKLRTDTSAGAETIATNQSAIDGRIFIANDQLFFARRAVGIYALPLSATAILRDFTASALEVTQAIQNLANSAPLVSGKTTYVRAYGIQVSGPNASNVEARLVGTRNGVPLPGSPLSPLDSVRSLMAGAPFDRASQKGSWNFLLPSSWTNPGAIVLRFEVDPRRIHTDPNLVDNQLSSTLSFQNQPPVCVWTAPVRTNAPLPTIDDPNFWSMVSHFDRRWPAPQTWVFRDPSPVEELEVCWYGPLPYPCYGPYELEEGWSLDNGIPDRDKVIASLWARSLLTFNPDVCDNIGAPVHFMGMVHPSANTGGVAGYASLYTKDSWVKLPEHSPDPIPAGWNNVRAGQVMAQELAHNYGRKHIDCGNPGDTDPNYPYPPCQISDTGPNEYYGFDTQTLTPIRPTEASDFMTYGSNRWVSDYTWRALINSVDAPAASPSSPVSAAAGSSVFVTGWLDTANLRGVIGSMLTLPTESIPPDARQAAQATMPTSGLQATFRLRLLGPTGSVLVERVLTPIPIDDHAAGDEPALFSDVFSKPAGQVATVQLLADETVLDSRTPGSQPPVVAIQQPAGGAVIQDALTIQWTASDPDRGDQLLYTVQYSHDNGVSWHTLAVNYGGAPGGGTLALSDLGSLPGGAPNAARIRVLASDGYNTGTATSQPFTVTNRKPDAFIVTPAAEQTFAAGQPVLLTGGATDAEDGGLSAAALAWSIDGVPSGSGTVVVAAGLAPGTHTAMLSASDADNNTSTKTVSFRVATLGVAAATSLTMDGVCSDAGYAGAVVIPLKAYDDGSQATMRLIRTELHLWACFSGLKQGALSPGALAGVRVDVDYSRSAQAQPSDYGFFIGENGSVVTYAGNGAGGFTDAGPGGLQAQMNAGATTWSGELRIDKTLLGGWDHLVGLTGGHYAVAGATDHYVWPYSATPTQPRTWATTMLGMQPVVDGIEPYSADAGSSALTLVVNGSSFPADARVLWNGSALPTTFVDAGRLNAEVGADLLAAAGTASVTVRSATPGSPASNSVAFQIAALAPVITSLSPTSAPAGSPATTLTVNGSGFVADSHVLWNGASLATQFVSPNKLTAQLDAALLTAGQRVGVAVRNPQPQERISNVVSFEVLAASIHVVFLPLVQR